MTSLSALFHGHATDPAASNDRRMRAAIETGAAMTSLFCDGCAEWRVHLLSDVVMLPNQWKRATCQCGSITGEWRHE